MDSFNPYGRVWLFHPSGAKIELPLPSYPQEAFSYIDDCLKAGFLTSAPDNTGLDKIDVVYVVRGQKTDDKGTTDRLYFYAAWAQQSSNMTVYLDTPEQVAKFERVSGLKVASMPIMKGKAAPAPDSRDFEALARPTNFTVTRKKVDAKDSPVGYRWELVDYVAGTPAQQPAQTAKDRAFLWVNKHQLDTRGIDMPTDDNNEVAWKTWCEQVKAKAS